MRLNRRDALRTGLLLTAGSLTVARSWAADSASPPSRGGKPIVLGLPRFEVIDFQNCRTVEVSAG